MGHGLAGGGQGSVRQGLGFSWMGVRVQLRRSRVQLDERQVREMWG